MCLIEEWTIKHKHDNWDSSSLPNSKGDTQSKSQSFSIKVIFFPASHCVYININVRKIFNGLINVILSIFVKFLITNHSDRANCRKLRVIFPSQDFQISSLLQDYTMRTPATNYVTLLQTLSKNFFCTYRPFEQVLECSLNRVWLSRDYLYKCKFSLRH